MYTIITPSPAATDQKGSIQPSNALIGSMRQIDLPDSLSPAPPLLLLARPGEASRLPGSLGRPQLNRISGTLAETARLLLLLGEESAQRQASAR